MNEPDGIGGLYQRLDVLRQQQVAADRKLDRILYAVCIFGAAIIGRLIFFS